MKKEIYQKIEIPEGIEVHLEDLTLKIKGSEGEVEKTFNVIKVDLKKEANQIIVGSKKATKNEKKLINSLAAHIRNMIKGVQEKFEYKLKICFSHFPITVESKDKNVLIKNFLGEKNPREMTIPEGVDVTIEKEIITVSSVDKELAGQVAANFETATRVRGRDKRVFQDGIFITDKPGRKI